MLPDASNPIVYGSWYLSRYAAMSSGEVSWTLMPDDLEPAIAVPVRELAQDRHLLLARRAPGREEVQPDDLAAERVEADGLPVEVDELVGRAIGLRDGELGRRGAGQQAVRRRRAQDVRRGPRDDRIGTQSGRAQRRGHDHQQDGDHGDGEGREQQLTAAERADQAVLGWLVGELRPGVGHVALKRAS